MFDSIAPRYDLLNRILSLGIDVSWRRRMVGMVRDAQAREILDLATGTADLAIMMAQRIPGSRITGADISQGMLSLGRAKVKEKGLEERITLVEGDACSLPFPEGSFDGVTAAFGVRNFSDIAAGALEMYRVLRPGGGVFMLEFGLPENRLFGAIYRLYFHNVLPRIGRIISRDKDAYTYLPQSVDEFPYGKDFVKIMREAGFDRCGFKNLFGGVAQVYYGYKTE